MKNLRPFEIAILGIFAAAAFGGIAYVALFNSSKTQETMVYGEEVIIWGPFDANAFGKLLMKLSSSNKAFQALRYEEIDERDFDGQLLNAIASGRSPDLIILSHSSLVRFRPILVPFTEEEYPVREYRDTYIDGAEIFLRSDGLYGLPFAVDPMVMYWNRDMFSSAGLPNPPRTWEALVSQTTPALVRRNEQLELSQSAVALGEYVNVLHAKEILAMLLLQAGSTIVEERGKTYSITLNRTSGNGLPPAQAALSFYTQFTTPTNAAYSWNRSQALDRDKFLGGTLALYFGLGSELKEIQKENPNLNFDLVPVPQGSGATTFRNYGEFYAFAIPRASGNVAGAKRAAYDLVTAENSSYLASELAFVPVHRELLAVGSNDAYQNVLFQSALYTRGWLDPSPKESGDVFRKMVEDTTSGKGRGGEVLVDAAHGLELLFK